MDFRSLLEKEPFGPNETRGLGLTNHNISLSSRKFLSFDKPEPQPNPLPNCPSLDISLGEQKGLKPPIKTHSPDSFRDEVINPLTIHTPPSPNVVSFHPKDVYCYHHPCIDDPKKHYGFKPGLLGQSGSLELEKKSPVTPNRAQYASCFVDPFDSGREAHLLEDKQIPSVGVFDEVSFYTLFRALRGYTRNLESFGKKRDKIEALQRSGFKNCSQSLKTASQFPSDAVRSYKRRRQKNYDGVRM
ncbi:hypothetical protein Tco_0782086 [Tanacetum coccineum]